MRSLRVVALLSLLGGCLGSGGLSFDGPIASPCEGASLPGLWLECADAFLVVQQACPSLRPRGIYLHDDGRWSAVVAPGSSFSPAGTYCERDGGTQSGRWHYDNGTLTMNDEQGNVTEANFACLVDRLGFRRDVTTENDGGLLGGYARLALAPSDGTSVGLCAAAGASCEQDAQCTSGRCEAERCVDAPPGCGSEADGLGPCVCGDKPCPASDLGPRCCLAGGACGVITPLSSSCVDPSRHSDADASVDAGEQL